MAEGGVEKRAMRTVLGFDEDGVSTSDAFDVVVKDHGVKAGLQYDSVCITPVVDTAETDLPEKTVQVLYTQEDKMQGNLKFATVAVWETPKDITDERTVSKMVHLRSGKFTSTMKSNCSRETEAGGVFVSDPEALSCIRLDPSQQATGQCNAEEPEEGIFASDPEALKFIRFGPKPDAVTSASSTEELEEGIFASDPEALKFIRFGPKSAAVTGASSTEEPEEGIFASDPEALKFIRFGPKPTAVTGASSTEEPEEGIFASDPEALKFIRFGPKPAAVTVASSTDCVKRDDEGELLAEAADIQLKDNRTYSVRVTGHELPDGQQKKFVSVRSADGGPTRQEIDAMQVSVETVVGEDGMVEKFIVVE